MSSILIFDRAAPGFALVRYVRFVLAGMLIQYSEEEGESSSRGPSHPRFDLERVFKSEIKANCRQIYYE